MARPVFLLISALQTLFIFTNAETDPGGLINPRDDTRIILEKLNSNPTAMKVYKSVDLIYSEFKADKTEKEVGVLARFQNRDCEGGCEEGSEVCRAMFENGVLQDVSCLAAVDRKSEEREATPPTAEISPETSNQPNWSEPCLGCPLDLNKNVEGLDELLNTALRHVESERINRHTVVNVLRIQQQIVAGVKYILLVEIAPTVCAKTDQTNQNCPIIKNAPSEICQIEFFQQPWISKNKNIVRNNCTDSQEFVASTRNERENEIDSSLVKNQGFTDERFSDTDSEWLAELESQIEVENSERRNVDEVIPSVRPLISVLDNAEIETTTTAFETSTLDKNSSEESEEDANNSEEDDASEEEKKSRKQRVDFENKNEDLDRRFIRAVGRDSSSESKESLQGSNSTESSEEQKGKQKRSTTFLEKSSDEEVDVNRRFFRAVNKDSSSQSKESVEGSNSTESSEEQKGKQKRSTTPLEKINPDEKPLVRHLADFAASTLDNIDDDNHKRIVLQILGAKKMKMQGTLYHLTMRIGVSRCFEDENDESCKDKLFENLTKICKVQVHVSEDQFSHRVLKSQCQTIKKDNSDINRTTHNRFRRALLGGKTKIPNDDPEINNLLLSALSTADSQLGSQNKLKPVEILSADKQTVAGYLYTIKVRLSPSVCSQNSVTPLAQCDFLKDADSKICDFVIWRRAWLKTASEVNVTCNDDAPGRFKREIITDSFEKVNFDAEYLFRRFVRTHKKMYSTLKEFKHRFKVFQRNLKHIQFLNENERGTAKYGITKFADLTRKEFSQKYLGYRPDLASENNIPLPEAEIPDIELPVSFDWRNKSAVSEVKDQGMCGSCWAFSVTGNVEGQYAIKYGKLQEFSEQELVDCDKLDEGCNGGLMDNAYRAIEKLGGLETEKDYPYDGESERCHFNQSLSRVQISGAVNISHNETDMAKWLVKNGPISIAINANAMQFYVGGVSHPYKFLCSPKSLDHGVLIVGYGVHNYPYFKKTLPYWIVKNSWGRSWGEQGYYRVYRGDGTCGLNQTPSSAIVA